MRGAFVPVLLAPLILAGPVLADPTGTATVKPQVGEASFYGAHHAGKKTASGERMNPNALTAASKTLPLGTVAKVTNLENGKSVDVVVNDRGPYEKGRIIDLSTRAANQIDMHQEGVAPVKVTPESVPAQPKQ